MMAPLRSARRRPKPARRERRWRVSLLRHRLHYLGTVIASDEGRAEAVAVERFKLDDEQRKRLVVREQDDR
jgi:hypothetical protein